MLQSTVRPIDWPLGLTLGLRPQAPGNGCLLVKAELKRDIKPTNLSACHSVAVSLHGCSQMFQLRVEI